MSYLDFSNAELFALARQRRAERRVRCDVEKQMADARRPIRFSGRSYEFDCWSPAPKKIKTPAFRPPDPLHPKWQNKRRGRPPDDLYGIQGKWWWWALFHAQEGRCFICGLEFLDNHWATVEHVHPRHRGGVNYKNVLLAHYGCNSWKAARMPHPCEKLYLAAIHLRVIDKLRVAPTA